MSNISLEKVLEDFRALPPEARRHLIEALEKEEQIISQSALPESNGVVVPSRFTLEMQWLENHRAEFVGQWVALDGDRLLAHGTVAREVFAAARNSGVELPLVVQVEPPDALPFGGW